MRELITEMANDMKIMPYTNETKESFVYRLCYSALGFWLLKTATNVVDGKIGTTKHNQTITINAILHEYGKIFPYIAEKFIDTSTMPETFAVHARTVYEETGYLLTDAENMNSIANYGRGVYIGNKILYFGLPRQIKSISGLGVFAEQAEFYKSLKEVLIRDELTPEQYLQAHFDSFEFYEKDFDLSGLEFFDPTAKTVPSCAWVKQPNTELSMARKSELGPYYRVIKNASGLLFSEETGEVKGKELTDCEYRRMYFALKKFYNNPLSAYVSEIDDKYVKIKIRGHLPNREYYFMLLLSHPDGNAFEKCNYIVKKAHIEAVKSMLNNIGVTIQGA